MPKRAAWAAISSSLHFRKIRELIEARQYQAAQALFEKEMSFFPGESGELPRRDARPMPQGAVQGQGDAEPSGLAGGQVEGGNLAGRHGRWRHRASDAVAQRGHLLVRLPEDAGLRRQEPPLPEDPGADRGPAVPGGPGAV